MFGLYIYRQYEIERPKTVEQQRAADIRRGEHAAEISQPVLALSGVVRSLFRAAFVRPSRPVTPPPVLVRCPDTVTRELLETELASAGSSAGWKGSGGDF
jgi:hypothetical protein